MHEHACMQRNKRFFEKTEKIRIFGGKRLHYLTKVLHF